MPDIADRSSELPPRDTTKPDTEQGLFRKFIVTRTDGSSGPGGKHEHCENFVLDVDHDPHAPAALSAYASAVEATHPQLADDLRARYRLEPPMPLEVHWSKDTVGVPILRAFDQREPLGWLHIRRDALPPTPDFCFAIGYSPLRVDEHRVVDYRLLSVAIIPDADYRKVIDSEQARYQSPQLYASSERILRRRARAFGIARDIADGFAQDANDGTSSPSLFRRLANRLLSEPEVVNAIADWRQAAREAVDGAPAADSEASERTADAEQRARELVAKSEALALRSTLSAHQEEWWRIHRDHDRARTELIGLVRDAIAARWAKPGRLQSDAASAAAIDALRSAEMPQAVPGRCRDIAEQLRAAYTPTARMTERWQVGHVADLLEQIADAWNRRPAAGTNLSRGKPAAVHASPAIVETTAMWAGAQTAQSDGAVHFSAEAWAKFVKCLGEEPPLEILTSPGVSAPASAVYDECATRGCREAKPCAQGECARGPGVQR